MKILFTIPCFLLLNVFCAKAQLHQMEPDSTPAQANYLPADTTMTGQTCRYTDMNYYKIILPHDGIITLYTDVSVADTPAIQSLSVSILSHDQNSINTFYPTVGANGHSVLDTFSQCCLAADTFYLQVYRSYAYELCYNYVISYTLTLPTYTNDKEPDQISPLQSLRMPYDSSVEGHLGFSTEPGGEPDENDCYTIVPPTDGTLKAEISVEAESQANYVMNVELYNKSVNSLGVQYANAGNFPNPEDTVFYWSCLDADTFYLTTGISNIYDGGYSYKMSYTMIQPVFGENKTPHHSFSEADVVNPNNNIDGHEYFYGNDSADYYKFYKGDTGYLKLYVQAETWNAAANGQCEVTLYDHNGNPYTPLYAPIGTNSTPDIDSLYFSSLPQDSFYIEVYNSNIYAPCMSYQIQLYSTSISGGINSVTPQSQISVYPNPATDEFTMDFGKLQNARIDIYNILGQLVESMQQPNNNKLTFGKELNTGVYIVKVSTGSNAALESKLVKIE